MACCAEFQKTLSQKYMQILASIAASFGCYVYSVAHNWPAPGIPKMLSNETSITITRSEASWIATIHLLGSLVILPLTLYLIKHAGSHYMILISTAPLVASWLMIVYAENVMGVYAARAMVGLAGSFVSTALPIYVGEVTEPSVRGGLASCLVISFSLGTMFTFYFGYVLPIKDFAVLSIALTVLHFLVFFPMPVSPVHLSFTGKVPEAKRALQILLQRSDVDAEYAAIEDSWQKQETIHGNFFDLFRTKVNLSALWIMLLSMSIVQFGGFTSLNIYIHLILIEAKVKMPVELGSMLFGLVQFLTCFVAALIIDKLGRRPLFIASTVGSAVCLLILSIYFYLDNENKYDNLALIILLVYVFIARIGIGVIPQVLRCEIFDNNVKHYGISTANIYFSLTGLLANKGFIFISDLAGMGAIMAIFAGFSLIGAVLVSVYVPETKNKTFPQIQEMILQRKLH